MNNQENINEIVRFFFCLQLNLKIYHWNTTSFSRHKATDVFNEKILELRNSNIKLASDIIKLRRCYKDSQEIINTYSSSSIILFGLNALTILYIIYK
jgi:DNA-binding ferritin-like protein